MSWGVNPDDLAAARDRLLERVAEHPTGHALEQLARTHAWLGEEAEARRRWRQAAETEEEHVHRWGREDPTRIARVGSLRLRADDREAARPWLERAVRAELRHDRLAALSYLLGGDDAAIGYAERAVADEEAPYPWVEAVAALAQARRDGDAAAAERARAGFAALIREERTPPDEESGSGDYSLFDWLAESYRAIGEAPSGREMLARNGLLSTERAPAPPPPAADAGPSGRGSRTVSNARPDGGEVEATVTVDARGDLEFVLDPERGLRAAIRQGGDGWRAWLGDEELPGEHGGPRGAKRALREPLRAQPHGQWAIALLDRLFTEGYRL